jgi:transcriptional regulator with XRE-family HTH domain
MKSDVRRLPQDPDRLYRRRVAMRLTQEGLAVKAGVSKSTVSRLERGLCPAEVDTLHLLAEALDCDVTDLMPLEPAVRL